MVRRSRALHAIREIAEHARETRSIGEFSQVVIDVLGDRAGFEYGAILLLEPGGALEPVALERPDEEPESLERDKSFVRSRLTDERQGLTSWVAEHGRSVRLGEVRDDPRYFSMRDDIRSELCVPIRVAGRTIGVLNTETTRRGAYSKRDQDLLEIAALEVAAVTQTLAQRPSLAASGEIVSLCATCKKTRGSDGVWYPVEHAFLSSGLQVSHGACPDCLSFWENPTS